MNAVDAVIVVLVLAFAAAGYLMGTVWQLAGLATLIVGTLAGWILSIPLTLVLARFVSDPVAAKALAFFMVFGAISLVIKLFASLIRTALQKWNLAARDKQLGVLFGAGNALLLATLVCTGIVMYSPRENTIRSSLSGPLLVRLGERFVSSASQKQIRAWIDQKMGEARQTLEDQPQGPEDGP